MLGGSLMSKLKSLFLHKKEEAKPRNLPDELYLEIFLRLPVRSTFTCKCVSKTWFSIISDPDFVKLHLKYTLKFKNSGLIISGYDRRMIIQASQIYTITKHSLFSTDEFYDKAVVMENHPFKSAKLVGIWGSCNGLVCLVHHNNVTKFVSLWNPATKEYKRIPYSPYSTASRQGYLCYDSNNDDYKLVYVVVHLDIPSFSVYIYNLRSDSWKSLETKVNIVKNYNAVLVNGALHWIAETSKVIVSFNISDESFKEIQLPREIMEKMVSLRVTLKVLEGCLGVILLQLNEPWVMRDYGVWESWTEIQDKISEDKYKDLKWSSENGKCLIYNQGTDLVLYGPKHSGARRLDLGSLVIRGVDDYVQSLVSLNTGTYVGRKEVIGTPRRRGIWRKRSKRY